jgi:hypothetical protein
MTKVEIVFFLKQELIECQKDCMNHHHQPICAKNLNHLFWFLENKECLFNEQLTLPIHGW